MIVMMQMLGLRCDKCYFVKASLKELESKQKFEIFANTGCFKSKYTLSNLIFFSGTDH